MKRWDEENRFIIFSFLDILCLFCIFIKQKMLRKFAHSRLVHISQLKLWGRPELHYRTITKVVLRHRTGRRLVVSMLTIVDIYAGQHIDIFDTTSELLLVHILSDLETKLISDMINSANVYKSKSH